MSAFDKFDGQSESVFGKKTDELNTRSIYEDIAEFTTARNDAHRYVNWELHETRLPAPGTGPHASSAKPLVYY